MVDKMRSFSYFDRPPQVGLSCPELSRTQQQFLEESDINVIVAKYGNMEGFVDPSIPRKSKPMFGDFASLGDYQEHMNSVLKVKEIFDDLPANIRVQFDNDPAIFAQFASDEQNVSKLVELGVIDAVQTSVLSDVADNADISASVTDDKKSSPEKEKDL